MTYLTITTEDFYRLNILAHAGHEATYKKTKVTEYQEQKNDDAELFRKLQAVVTLKLEAEFQITQTRKA